MALKLRYDNEDHVLRSIGDPPHGILVCTIYEDVPSFAISGKWTPQPIKGASSIEMVSSEEQEDDETTRVELADVVAGCDPAAIPFLWQAACMSLEGAMALGFHRKGDTEPLRAAIGLLEETRDEILRQDGEI